MDKNLKDERFQKNILKINSNNNKSGPIFSSRILSKSESVKFLLIKSVICLFTDSPVKKYISLFNQLIITN